MVFIVANFTCISLKVCMGSLVQGPVVPAVVVRKAGAVRGIERRVISTREGVIIG